MKKLCFGLLAVLMAFALLGWLRTAEYAAGADIRACTGCHTGSKT